MQVCTSLQAENHASTPPLNFFTGQMPFLRLANSVQALKYFLKDKSKLCTQRSVWRRQRSYICSNMLTTAADTTLTSAELDLSAVVREPADFSVAVDVNEAQREQSTDALIIAVTHILLTGWRLWLAVVVRLRVAVVITHFWQQTSQQSS